MLLCCRASKLWPLLLQVFVVGGDGNKLRRMRNHFMHLPLINESIKSVRLWVRVQVVTLYWYVGSSWFHGSGLLVLFQLIIKIETDLEYAQISPVIAEMSQSDIRTEMMSQNLSLSFLTKRENSLQSGHKKVRLISGTWTGCRDRMTGL